MRTRPIRAMFVICGRVYSALAFGIYDECILCSWNGRCTGTVIERVA